MHFVLIWIIPFIWIFVLKVLIKHLPEPIEIVMDENAEKSADRFSAGEWRSLNL
jgi:hypothetical protein